MTKTWISSHSARDRMPRHRHAEGYAALVLAGGYVEAGDRGRVAVQAGHVVIHHAFEAHEDHFSRAGAVVLNLPHIARNSLTGVVQDPDAIARLAERDITAAANLLQETFRPVDAQLADWPDRLAA